MSVPTPPPPVELALPAPAATGRTTGPCVLVIFGASGDLTKRKLLPAVCHLAGDGLLGANFVVLGVAIETMSDDAYRQKLTADMGEIAPEALQPGLWDRIAGHLHYMQGEFHKDETFARLKQRLADLDERYQTGGNYLFYLATAPTFFGPLVEHLHAAGLTAEEGGRWRRVIIEKPFGHDLASAKALNAQILRVLSEQQIYRIDHYLGKETVQNIVVLRFANGMFEPVWNRRYVDHVQITVAESLGVEHRGGYYDKAGALRDMVPNHLFQLMTLTAMEPPISMSADEVRDEQVKILHAIQPLVAADLDTHAVRGQYGAGPAGVAYQDEPMVTTGSQTETFVALKLGIDNWRWAGVPFYLRTGKRMPERLTKIVVQFRQPPFLLFRDTPVDKLTPSKLVVNIQPHEGLSLWFEAKVPGTLLNLGPVRMNFRYADVFGEHPSTGYETLLFDAMIGDATLFQRADMVEAAWAVVQPVLSAWQEQVHVFPNYPAGTWGPPEATALMTRDGREWHDPIKRPERPY